MKKWQEWLIVVIVGIFILMAVGATYYYLTMEKAEEVIVETEPVKVEGESELTQAEKELKEVEDMDLSELDAIEKDLDSIDLTEL